MATFAAADPLARVRSLAADARWLDALDALEALGAAAAADPALRDDVTAHGERFRKARALCGDDSDAAAEAEPWQGNFEAFGVKTSFRYFRRADISLMNRGDAAAATWIVRGDESWRRRLCDADILWRSAARR